MGALLKIAVRAAAVLAAIVPAAFILAGVGPIGVRPAWADDAVVLHDRPNFSGRTERLTGDDPNLADNLIRRGTLSSIKVPRGWLVTVFEGPNYSGRSQTFSRSVSDLNRTAIGSDKASSIRIIKPSQSASGPGVTIYRDANFKARPRP